MSKSAAMLDDAIVLPNIGIYIYIISIDLLFQPRIQLSMSPQIYIKRFDSLLLGKR
jgi:hypothetical protein